MNKNRIGKMLKMEEDYETYLSKCSDAAFDLEMEKAERIILKVFKIKAQRGLIKEIENA